MLDSIYGRLQQKKPTEAVIDISGMRFMVNISVPTYERLPAVGEPVELLSYLHVKEDILALYGFWKNEERQLFMLLIGISGIGPRSAMTILSGTNPNEFKNKIVTDDVKSLTNVPGIGPKTAKRIIVELKEKFVNFQDDDMEFLSESGSTQLNDAVMALMALGFKRQQCQQALKKLEKEGQLDGGLESVIKKALAKM